MTFAPFDARYIRARGKGAERLATMLQIAQTAALATQGLRAFECPKTSAAFHEAGHCVVSGVDGHFPTKVSIWRVDRSQWVGRTLGLPRGRVDNTTPAEADLKQARSQLAGVASEALFDPDYRSASSLDEIVTATTIVRSAAFKLLRDPETLFFETLDHVVLNLSSNKEIVCRIADVLLARGCIKPAKLARLLQAVRRPQ